jgi:hypothetical protein
MAWDEFQRGSIRGVSGDEPIDEMRYALKRIRRSYLERFGRSPYFAELLHTLLTIVEANPSAYVIDDDLPYLERLSELVGAATSIEHIDPSHYEGASDAESEDFLVLPRVDVHGDETMQSPVIRGQIIKNDSILCRYTIHSPLITDRMAKILIRQCVLHDLMNYNINDTGLTILFERMG